MLFWSFSFTWNLFSWYLKKIICFSYLSICQSEHIYLLHYIVKEVCINLFTYLLFFIHACSMLHTAFHIFVKSVTYNGRNMALFPHTAWKHLVVQAYIKILFESTHTTRNSNIWKNIKRKLLSNQIVSISWDYYKQCRT